MRIIELPIALRPPALIMSSSFDMAFLTSTIWLAHIKIELLTPCH